MGKKMPYEEILEKYEVNSLERFNKLFKSENTLDKYIATIMKDSYGDIIDISDINIAKDSIDDILDTSDHWVLPLEKAVEFQKVYPRKKNFFSNESDGQAYKFLKEKGLV